MERNAFDLNISGSLVQRQLLHCSENIPTRKSAYPLALPRVGREDGFRRTDIKSAHRLIGGGCNQRRAGSVVGRHEPLT